jgi:hypothetical protein
MMEAARINKSCEFLDWSSNHKLFMEDPVPWHLIRKYPVLRRFLLACGK